MKSPKHSIETKLFTLHFKEIFFFFAFNQYSGLICLWSAEWYWDSSSFFCSLSRRHTNKYYRKGVDNGVWPIEVSNYFKTQSMRKINTIKLTKFWFKLTRSLPYSGASQENIYNFSAQSDRKKRQNKCDVQSLTVQGMFRL